jgi:hypothetical protein
MKTDIPALLTLLLICAFMLSCGGFWDSDSSGSGTSKAVLYVINNNGGDAGGVVPFSIKSSGKLSKISDQVAAGNGPNSAVISSDNKYSTSEIPMVAYLPMLLRPMDHCRR